MPTPAKRPRTQSSESNETRPARKLTRLEDEDESSDRVEESPQGPHSAAAGHTFNAIGTSGTVTMVAGHIINNDYHMHSTADNSMQSPLISQSQLDDKKSKIHAWMKAPDTSPSYNAARKKHQTGTGSWFLDGSQFAAWKERPGSVLWLRGGPGCGKTILSSSVIKDVVNFCDMEPAARGYAYFFFDGTKAQSESLNYESLLRSIITQLSNRCDANIPNALVDLYNKCDEGNRQPFESQLENTHSQMLEIFDSTHIVIDALDECVEKADVLRWIESVAVGTSGRLHLMLTSRPEADIEQGLASLHNLQKVSVGEKSTDDIGAYLDARLRAADMSQWDEPEKQMIKTGLSAGSGGMFRWVALQVDAINKCKNRAELTAQLNSLPKGLDETYTRIFERSEYPDYLRKLLQWLVFSKRPLTVAELAEVLAMDFNTSDVPFYDPDMRCQTPAVIWSICNGLVTEFEGTVKVAHFSVKEYLIKRIKPEAMAQSSTSEQFSHSVIAQDCLAQLLHFDGPSIMDWENTHSIALEHIKSSFPLALYAAVNWVSHFQSSGAASTYCPRLEKLLLRLFKLPWTIWSHTLLSWVQLQNLALDTDPNLRYESTVLGRTIRSFKTTRGLLPLDASALYYACFVGSFTAVQHLVTSGADINKVGCEASSRPLLIASQEGHVEIARLLLDSGANFNAEGGHYGTALQAAISKGHAELAELLLDKGANVNVEGGHYGTALQAASARDHVEIAKHLLNKGADVNIVGGYHGTALNAASRFGQLELVKLLLVRGASVNIKGGNCGTALQGAIAAGNLELSKLLLDNGADANTEVRHYGSALQAAIAEGHVELAKILLDKGANVNVEIGHYGTALQAAIEEGHLELARLLLEKGANVNIKAGRWGTALRAAIEEGYLQLAKLLLDKGADVNVEAGGWGTPLQAASAKGYVELAKLLLDKGANVDVKGGYYGTALQTASGGGHFEVARLLLDRGANVNVEAGTFGTALRAASARGHVKLVKLLRERGAVGP